jgi:dTDP-4-dehydrorhamnose reductase
VRILIAGALGQVGRDLQHRLHPLGTILAMGRDQLDLAQADQIPVVIERAQPHVIVNAAAYTAVDKAETEVDSAYQINAVAPGILAQTAQRMGVPLLHLSTDYVFDGSQGSPYPEDAPTRPLGVYGQSKQQGEEAVRTHCQHHVILRTAWVYGTYGRSNFVKTMLRLGAEREEIRVVADQVGAPTWSADLADAIAHLIPHLHAETGGTYHFTNSGVASWYDVAVAIFEDAAALGLPLQVKQVTPITTAEYPTPARRPSYSVLSCTKITQLLGYAPPHWRQSLRKMLTELHS